MMLALRGTVIVAGHAEGVAMVTSEALALSMIEPKTGMVKQPDHPWAGQSICGKVLFFPSGKGSASGSYWLLNLANEGNAPAAIVNAQTDAVIVAGAVLADIPLVHRVIPDPFGVVCDGDHVCVDGDTGVIEVERAGA